MKPINFLNPLVSEKKKSSFWWPLILIIGAGTLGRSLYYYHIHKKELKTVTKEKCALEKKIKNLQTIEHSIRLIQQEKKDVLEKIKLHERATEGEKTLLELLNALEKYLPPSTSLDEITFDKHQARISGTILQADNVALQDTIESCLQETWCSHAGLEIMPHTHDQLSFSISLTFTTENKDPHGHH